MVARGWTLSLRALAVLVSLLGAPLHAQDWPCWRGAEGDGVAKCRDWSCAGTKLWSRNVGVGFSSAAVVGPRLYTLGFDVAQKLDTLYCLAADTGDVLWTATCHGRLRTADRHDGGTLSTPAVAGDSVYVSSSEGWLRSWNARTGELRWARAVADEVGTAPDEYGFAASPVVFGGLVIVCVDRVVGVERETGKILWSSEPVGDDHSTPAPFAQHGLARLAVFGKSELCLLDPASGAQLGSYPWSEGHVGKNIATPVVVGERIFLSSAENRGGALLESTSTARARRGRTASCATRWRAACWWASSSTASTSRC